MGGRTVGGRIRIDVPAWARFVLDALEDAGFEAWCVGGFVRDAFLGREACDVDVATSAVWTDVRDVFRGLGAAVIETGARHGTVTVRSGGRNVEVTTYRADGVYEDGRHPSSVSFVGSVEEDLARRDFTMNALAYHPRRGLLDPFDGLSDVRAGVVRAVGDPSRRFQEDALRILRAVRFASQLGFSVEERTERAMFSQAGSLRTLSGERVSHELDGVLCGERPHDALTRYVDVLGTVLPELLPLKGFDQRNPCHVHDVLEHTAWAVQRSRRDLRVRWALLLHDVGKPECFALGADGRGHFHGHPARSVELARGVLGRMRKSARFSADVLALVELHDADVPATRRAVKRALRRLDGRVDLLRDLCEVKRADARAQSFLAAGKEREADAVERVLDEVLAAHEAFSVKDLAVDGRDVLAAGVAPGPAVGRVLDDALSAVVDGAVDNEREALLAFLRRSASEGGR